MRPIAPSFTITITIAITIVAALSLGACDRKNHSDIDIPTAKTRAALALSAFECSHLATAQADTSRLFNLGLQAGREFLDFADNNQSGYQSISNQIDPVWTRVEARPSVDFKLGELHAYTIARAIEWRGRYNDSNWEGRRQQLYVEKNCQFLAIPVAKS